MQRASAIFDDDGRQRVQRAVAAAEAGTSCEIVPVVASASGRYDRSEDIVGLWLAVIVAVVLWRLLPPGSDGAGDWAALPALVPGAALVAGMVVAFIVGAWAAARIGWLRRLFTPRRQMREEAARRAREVFFDQRVHHTRGATGLLLYVSLFERAAVVLADRQVMEHEALGRPFVDELCRRLTGALAAGHPAAALADAIDEAGRRLSAALPREAGDVDELADTLVVMDE